LVVLLVFLLSEDSRAFLSNLVAQNASLPASVSTQLSARHQTTNATYSHPANLDTLR
jgi:hypothetical protein